MINDLDDKGQFTDSNYLLINEVAITAAFCALTHETASLPLQRIQTFVNIIHSR